MSNPINYKKIVPEYNSYGLITIPLKEKTPILKEWNLLSRPISRIEVFKNHNIGILTGVVSGITVLDIDVKNNGLKVWKALSSAFPEITTPISRTASGGLHIYFRYNKKLNSFSKFKLRGEYVGWDLLNNNRQAVAPPSVNTKLKKKYKWVVHPNQVEFAKMPAWLEDYLLQVKSFR